MSKREERKLDHVRLATEQRGTRPQQSAGPTLQAPGFQDVHLVHQSLPELALSQIDLRTSVGGVALAHPIIINAMTGGADGVAAINRGLATVAAELGLAMAVGSQSAGLRNPAVAGSYQVVREVNPRGVVLANVSAGASVAEARAAVEMVEADLLQIHLNAPQELVMPEGDRDFRGQLDRIAELVARMTVPVVVKECGFGLSRESVEQLYEAGVRTVDVSGRGGTNFAWIEAQRRESGAPELDPGLMGWGIPTACSLLEAATLDLPGLEVIASGGISWGSEAARALALGARAVGVAGAVLGRLQEGGVNAALTYLAALLEDLARAALLCGAGTLADLQRCPVVITGETRAWSALRGVDLESLARRR